MFLENAGIHDHEDASLAGFLGGALVNHFLLHPDRRNFELDRLVDDFFHRFGAAENVDDVNFFRDLE